MEEPAASTAADPTLLAGRYRLGEVIGRGGMAEVYRAEDLKLDRLVAVKMLLDGAGDDSDRERFVAEARTLAMLSHTGLVTVLDAGFGVSGQQAPGGGTSVDQPFLVMELVEGPTLGQLLKAGPMSLEDLGSVAMQIAEALAYVHASGVVHRDVKPGNVLVGRDNCVKLADFGIARLMEQRTHLTRRGLTIGTAAYIAPEQVTGGEVDGSADVYALGLVLLEAITGRREYEGSPSEAALARLTRPPEIPVLPSVWHDLLTAMTALDPADRPSAADVASTLRVNLGEPAPLAPVGVPAPPAAPALATAEYDVSSAEGFDRAVTDPTAARPVRGRRTFSLERVRRLPADTWGVVAAAVALVAFIVVMAIVGGGDTAPEIPGNTPSELREPLIDLHRAVNGDDG